MKILVACEESQAVTIELRKRGHEAFSCDIASCSGGHEEWHLQQDVVPLLSEKWDMIIAFPPCTYLSNAGASTLYRGGTLNQKRYQKGLEAKLFFLSILNASCPKIAVENPISSRIFDMPLHTQEIQPWQFGHPYTKKTRLWLKGLPLLIPTDIVTPELKWVRSRNGKTHEFGSRTNVAKEKSKTFPGIARAMAEQWG